MTTTAPDSHTLADVQRSALALTPGSALVRLRADHETAKNSGNYAYTTTSGLRLAVASGCPAEVSKYLLNEMGIGAMVRRDTDGILIGFGRFSHHSHATVLRALQGEFRVLCAMLEDGSQALKIHL